MLHFFSDISKQIIRLYRKLSYTRGICNRHVPQLVEDLLQSQPTEVIRWVYYGVNIEVYCIYR